MVNVERRQLETAFLVLSFKYKFAIRGFIIRRSL
jgi:hypothetical protein